MLLVLLPCDTATDVAQTRSTPILINVLNADWRLMLEFICAISPDRYRISHHTLLDEFGHGQVARDDYNNTHLSAGALVRDWRSDYLTPATNRLSGRAKMSNSKPTTAGRMTILIYSAGHC